MSLGIMGPNWELPWNPSDYHSTIVLRGLRRALNRPPLCREVPVSSASSQATHNKRTNRFLFLVNPFFPTVPTFAVWETSVSRTANAGTVGKNGISEQIDFCFLSKWTKYDCIEFLIIFKNRPNCRVVQNCSWNHIPFEWTRNRYPFLCVGKQSEIISMYANNCIFNKLPLGINKKTKMFLVFFTLVT